MHYEELQVPQLNPLVNKYLNLMKAKLLSLKTENNVIDGFLGKFLEENDTASVLFDSSIRPLILSILAYHVNATETKTSEERTTELLWKVFMAMGNSHKLIQALKEKTPENITLIIKKSSSELADLLVPVDLWKRYVSDESSVFITRENLIDGIAKLLYGLQENFAHLELLKNSGKNALEKQSPHLDMVAFLQLQVNNLLCAPNAVPDKEAADEKTDPTELSQISWIKNVKDQLLRENAQANSEKPLNWIVESVLYQICSSLFINQISHIDDDVFANFEERLGNVMKMVKEKFDLINDKKNGLSTKIKNPITEDEKTEFNKMVHNPGLVSSEYSDELYTQLVYWVIARRAIDLFITDPEWDNFFPNENQEGANLLKEIVTKNLIASFITPLLGDFYHLRNQLEIRAVVVATKIGQGPTSKFIEDNLIAPLQEMIENMGENQDDLESLHPFVRGLLTHLLGTGVPGLKSLRERLIEQAVYMVVGQLVNVDAVSDDPEDSTKINDKMDRLIVSYKTIQNNPEAAKNDLAVARELLEVVPDAAWDQYFTGVTADLVTREKIIEIIVPFVSQIRTSANRLREGTIKAEEFFRQFSNSYEIEPQIEEGLQMLNQMVDDIGSGQLKIGEGQPKIIQNVIKGSCLSATTAPIIKAAMRSLLYVGLHNLLKGNQGALSKRKLMEAVANVIQLFEPQKQTDRKVIKRSLENLLLLLFPENLRKAYLPQFIQGSVTHEKLIEWFLTEQVNEIEKIKDQIDGYSVQSEPIQRLQQWIDGLLISQLNDPHTFSQESLLSDLHTVLIASDKRKDVVEPTFRNYLSVVVDQAFQLEGAQRFLKPSFLSFTLNTALKEMDTVTLPPLQPGKKFSEIAADRLLALLNPPSDRGNLVPKQWTDLIEAIPSMGKGIAATLAKTGVTAFVDKLVSRNERILFLTGFLAPEGNEVRKNELKALSNQIDIKNQSQFSEMRFLKDAKSLFHKNLADYASKKVDTYVESLGIRFGVFKWIAKTFLKIIVSLALNISIKKRIWNFVSSEENNEKISKII